MPFVTRARTTTKEHLRLSKDQLRDLPRHTKTSRDRASVITACNTGLRTNELVRLRVRDVDLGAQELRVDVTKSGVQDRVPITKELRRGLELWLREYEDDAGELDDDWYLFPRYRVGGGRRSSTGRFIGSSR